MSAYGYIHFFTDKKPKRPQDWVYKTLELFSTIPGRTKYEIDKTIEILSEWKDFEEFRDHGIETYYMENPLSQWRSIEDRVMEVDPSIIENHDYDNSILSISPYPSQLLRRVSVSHDMNVPEEIRGNFRIGDIEFYIGEHDIFSADEWGEGDKPGIFYGRAFYDFHLCGQGCPKNWKEFRRQVFELPEIIDLKEKIESFAGPVKTCAYWNV